ncbi:unnamed protein product, partial [Darwinula stevensoni]
SLRNIHTFIFLLHSSPDDGEKYWKFYVKPWTRFGPYLIGLVLGYIFHRIKGKNIKLSKVVVLAGWCAAIATNMAVIYGLEYYMKPLSPAMPRAAQVIYAAVHRVAWSIGLAWVVFACHIGAGGPVNTLLSWKAFVPLGRLTYSAYLVHVLVAGWYQFGIDSSVYVDHETQVREGFRTIQVPGVSVSFKMHFQVIVFLSTLILTHFVAVIFSLTFEIPVLGLEKIFCGLIFGEGSKPGHNNFPVAIKPHSMMEGEKGKDFSKGKLEVLDLNLASPETGILKGDIVVHDVSWEKPKYSGLENPAFIPDTKQKLGHDESLDGQSQHKSLSSFSHSTPRDSSEETLTLHSSPTRNRNSATTNHWTVKVSTNLSHPSLTPPQETPQRKPERQPENQLPKESIQTKETSHPLLTPAPEDPQTRPWKSMANEPRSPHRMKTKSRKCRQQLTSSDEMLT